MTKKISTPTKPPGKDFELKVEKHDRQDGHSPQYVDIRSVRQRHSEPKSSVRPNLVSIPTAHARPSLRRVSWPGSVCLLAH